MNSMVFVASPGGEVLVTMCGMSYASRTGCRDGPSGVLECSIGGSDGDVGGSVKAAVS